MSKKAVLETELNTLPTLRRAEVVDMCSRLGVPGITERLIRYATMDGRLATHRIGVANYYSEADVLAWIHSMRREGTATGGDAA